MLELDHYNPYPAEFIYSNFQSLQLVSRSSAWKLLIFVKFKINHLQILMFKHRFHSQYQCFDRLKKTG